MKHIFKDTIVLLNDLENMEMLLKKGIEFSVSHQVPLQVMYVHETPMFQMPDIFLSKEKRVEGSLDKERVKQEIENTIRTLGYEQQYAIFVYENDTLGRLTTLLRDRKEVLVITRYQEEVVAKLIEKTPYAYCIVKASRGKYEKVALPVDLDDTFQGCIETSNKLFENGEIELIYDYRFMQENFMVSEEYMGVAATSTQSELEVAEVLKESQRERFNGYLEEYKLEGAFLEGEEVMYEDLIKYIENNRFDLTLLYRNSNEVFFGPNLTIGLMREINTDFFVCQE